VNVHRHKLVRPKIHHSSLRSSLKGLTTVLSWVFHRFSPNLLGFSPIVPEFRERISLSYSSHRTVLYLALWFSTGKSLYLLNSIQLLTFMSIQSRLASTLRSAADAVENNKSSEKFNSLILNARVKAANFISPEKAHQVSGW